MAGRAFAFPALLRIDRNFGGYERCPGDEDDDITLARMKLTSQSHYGIALIDSIVSPLYQPEERDSRAQTRTWRDGKSC